MNLGEVITPDMSDLEKRLAVERAIYAELQVVAETRGWQMLMEGIQLKIQQRTEDLTLASKILDPREEDRKRGEIAAYRDVLESVEKAAANVALSEQQAANIKEQQREYDAADPLDDIGTFIPGGVPIE